MMSAAAASAHPPLETELVPADYFRPLRREEIFPDTSRPLELDVGSGDGSFLLGLAESRPDTDFLGIERLNGRVRKIIRGAARRNLTNVRILSLESAYALRWLFPEGLADRVHLLFPDPWPKKKHAARRFVREENLPVIHRVLRPEGEFLFKTDHEPYFEEAVEVLGASPLFRRMDWLPPEEPYPVTDFERQWMEMGKTIQGARWKRVSTF